MVFRKTLIWTIVSSFAFANATYANPTPSLTEGNIVTTTARHCSSNWTQEDLHGCLCHTGIVSATAIPAWIMAPCTPLSIIMTPIAFCLGASVGILKLEKCCYEYTSESELNLSYPAGPVQETMTEEDDSCPICLDEFSAPTEGSNQTPRKIVVITPCKHKICEPCFKKLLKSELTDRCPVCRRKMSAGDKVILFQTVSAHNTPPPPDSTMSESVAALPASAPSNEDDSVGSNTPAPDYF